MYNCPHCGHQLPHELNDGLSACLHCHRIFDSCIFNRLLAASWLIRKDRVSNFEQFLFHSKLREPEAILVFSLVYEHCYSHDEFLKALRMFGISSDIRLDKPA
jgi:hypothetical protein